MEQPFTILIVEDEVISVMALQMQLQKAGYIAEQSVAIGEEAIEIVKQSPPSLILMDIGLGGDLDGVETAQQIRTFSNVPVIFLTSYEKEPLKERIDALKPSGFLSKAVLFHELKALIDTFRYNE